MTDVSDNLINTHPAIAAALQPPERGGHACPPTYEGCEHPIVEPALDHFVTVHINDAS